MSLLQSVARRVARTLNHYAGAQPAAPRRPVVPAFYRDARFDANQFTRYEMARKIRDFSRNVWLIGALRSTYSKYSVGPNGLRIEPASSDPEWNKYAAEHYEKWCESPSLDSALPMGEQHQLMADTTHIDGGFFLNFTSRKVGPRQSIPAIQLIEGHRVATPTPEWPGGIGFNQDRPGIVDGVNIDESGRPNGYWMRTDFNGDKFVFRPIYDPSRPLAGGVMHVYDPDRIGQYRELTPYAPVLNQIQDLDLLKLLEMDRAKENAKVAYWLKTVDGELPNAQNMIRGRFNTTTPNGSDSDPDAEMQKRIQQYSTVLGSRVMSMKVNEEFQQLGSESPSAATQWYWLQLYEEICQTVSIPIVLVMPRSYQGTVARGIYDDAQVWFTDRFHTFSRPALASYRHFISWAKDNILDLADPPADYLKAHITPPRAVNVDVGYNSAAELASLAAAVTNYDDIAGKNGKTARELLTKKARNVALVKQISAEVSKETGVEVRPEEVCAPMADILARMAQANQANAVAESTENQPKKAMVEA
jgi:hypothetical protein